MIKKNLSLILLLLCLGGCGQLNVQNSCDCELEKNSIAELEAKLVELKKLQDKSTELPKKSFSEYSLLRKTKWEEIESKLQNDQASQAWPAWIHGCESLIKLDDWKSVCEKAKNLLLPTNKEVIKYLYTHFDLYKAHNERFEVKGEGVIGEQPIIKPGDMFTYTSGTEIDTPIGSMLGLYNMITDEGGDFEAKISEFELIMPRTLH